MYTERRSVLSVKHSSTRIQPEMLVDRTVHTRLQNSGIFVPKFTTFLPDVHRSSAVITRSDSRQK